MTNGHWVLLQDYRTPDVCVAKGTKLKFDGVSWYICNRTSYHQTYMKACPEWFAFVESKPEPQMMVCGIVSGKHKIECHNAECEDRKPHVHNASCTGKQYGCPDCIRYSEPADKWVPATATLETILSVKRDTLRFKDGILEVLES